MRRREEAGRWLVLSALAPPRGEEFLMQDALHRLGARAVVREGERILAWLPPPDDVEARLREAEIALRASTSTTDPALAWWWQSHEEWAQRWVRTAEPRRVTARMIVAPMGRELEQSEGDVVVRLEAGVTFGTAEHATTRGCLRLLESVLEPGDRVIDIGTGSGILAIAAALLGALRVLALDADHAACASARRNAAANAVADRVDVRRSLVRPADLQSLPRADVILANLEASLIRSFLPGFRSAVTPDGSVIVSGVTGGERIAVLRAAAEAGFGVRVEDDVEGWWCAAFRPDRSRANR